MHSLRGEILLTVAIVFIVSVIAVPHNNGDALSLQLVQLGNEVPTDSITEIFNYKADVSNKSMTILVLESDDQPPVHIITKGIDPPHVEYLAKCSLFPFFVIFSP